MKTVTIAAAVAALALMTACGKKEEAAAPASAPATSTAPATTTAPAATTAAPAAATTTTAAPAAAGDLELGKSVFGKACALCHAAGVAGAPKPGDKTDWGPRIAQGNDLLYKHALEGYTGSKGAMPARGGNNALKDEEVKAAVDYMVAQSR